MRTIFTMLASFTLAAPLAAQSTANASAGPAYDQVAVSLSAITQGDTVRREPSTLHAVGWPLVNMVAMAYGIDRRLIFGLPPLEEHSRYNIDATVTRPESTHTESNLLLRSLLTDHFGLQAHIEEKQLPVYVLTLADSGARFLPAAPVSGRSGTSKDNGHVTANAANMKQILKTIGGTLDRPISDRTGLAATYTLQLDYDASSMSEEAHFQAIAKALHDQLGLDLKPGTGAVKVLIVDKLDTSQITAKAARD